MPVRRCGSSGCPPTTFRTSHVLQVRSSPARLQEEAYPERKSGSRNLGQSSDF
ncbi:UNVERIFIED_CONTAM: hypothetical protein Slati_0192200 [Sesamum latifolium]|uniref:Uncharacterized protein n=1 Tax=Sesamum latifolium TaxID=2727402 RepID=A0AAW2YAX2_9LAMI